MERGGVGQITLDILLLRIANIISYECKSHSWLHMQDHTVRPFRKDSHILAIERSLNACWGKSFNSGNQIKEKARSFSNPVRDYLIRETITVGYKTEDSIYKTILRSKSGKFW